MNDIVYNGQNIIVLLGNTGPQGNPGNPIRQSNIFMSNPRNLTVTLMSYAEYGFTINQLDNLQVASGNITVSVLINNVPVTGLNDIEVTTTPQTAIATGNNTVNIGDRVTFAMTANNNSTNLETTMKGTIT